MPRQPFHHGHLRVDLLQRAETVLQERGVEKLSLRELARDAGVSHGAPRSHFKDRSALLDALAERGFDRLAQTIRSAVASVPEASTPEALRAAGCAYLDFAMNNPALSALMVAAKAERSAGLAHDAAGRLFGGMTSVVAAVLGSSVDGAPIINRLTLVLSATIQGIASLAASGRIPPEQGGVLLDDAIDVFLRGARDVLAQAI